MMDMDPLDALVSAGLGAYQAGNYPKALAEFEKALQLAPEDQAVREAAAYSANKAEDWDSAASHWLEISKQNPRRVAPVNRYIAALLKARHFTEARAYCESGGFLQDPANRPRYYDLRLMISLSESKLVEAADLAAKGYALSPQDSTALAFASQFFDHGHYGEMRRWVARIKAPEQQKDAIKTLQARAFFAQKIWNKARRAWQAILETAPAPQADTARLFLARIAASTGRHEEAKKHFELILQKQPAHEEAISYFIRAELLNNNETGARRLIDRHWDALDPIRRLQLKARSFATSDPLAGAQVFLDALESQPENITLELAHIRFLLDLKNVTIAEERIRTLIDLRPAHFELNLLYLQCLQMQDAPVERQLEQAEATLALAPADASLLNTVGTLLARNNRRADAAEHYQAAIKIAPGDAVLWRNGTYHLATEDRLQDAADFAATAIKTLGTDSPEQLTNTAWILLAARQTKFALEHANAAIKLDPASASAHEMAANVHMDEGRYDLAWDHIQKIDALVFPRRPEKIAHLAAQCMAAFRAMSDEGAPIAPPVKGLFPEQLFHAMVKRAMPDISGQRRGIMHVSSSLAVGGAERQVAYAIQGLMRRPDSAEPCSLVVSSLNPQTGHDFFRPGIERAGVEIVDLERLRQSARIRRILADFPAHARTVRQLASLPREASRVAIPLFAHLLETRPRVVHLWQDAVNIAAGIAAVSAGVPKIVLCTRSTRPTKMFRFRRYLFEGYQALRNYSGTVLMVNNSANGAHDYEAWLGLPAGSIHPFYNGYDFAAIRANATPTDRQSIRRQCGIPKSAAVIGGVMRFTSEKRPDLWVQTLMASIARAPDTHGLLVGEGPMQGMLMQMVKAAGLEGRIHFAGRQTPIEPWMRAMDILFLSSATEGLPNVLIEAQALGLPVASMNVGGAPEAIRAGETGLILEEAAPDILAQHIGALLQDSARMAAMSAAAVRFVEGRFSLETMVAALETLYETA